MEYWSSGVVECWKNRVVECWNDGVLEPSNVSLPLANEDCELAEGNIV